VVSPLSNFKRAQQTSPVNETGLNDRYTFDNFVVGPGSRFSHAAALAVSESPGRAYNPLFIHGPVGLGKTHLLQGIAHHTLRMNPNLKALYMSGERFTNLLIGAIQNRSTESFRQKFRSLDLLLIDDVHFLAGKESTQEEFFHTFNALYDAHKQIVVASDRSPRDISQLEERLVSRFGWGLVTDIQPPDLETRIAILRKKIELQPSISIPDDVLFFIANRIKSNIRELEGALVRVTAFCSLTGSSVTLRVAEEVLKETVSEEAHKISIDLIQRKVADYFGLKPSDLRAKKRSKSIAHPRQLAMFLVREMTSYSLPEIGEYFGGRDHATVLHAWKKVKGGLENNSHLSQTLDEIRRNLQRD
jgi:chromosomal replication initiator protein